jgi:hypothetical protein
MKTLQESLQESLAMYEAFRNLKVYMPDCDTAPTICKEYPTTDPYNSDAEEGKFNIDDTDWLHCRLGNNSGNIAEICWCEESMYGNILKANNEVDLRKDFDKNVSKWLEDNREEIAEDDYIEMYIDLDCGISFDCGSDKEDFGDFSLDTLWEMWMKQYTESSVDGDSGYARILVDLKKKKLIAGPTEPHFEI